MLALTRCNACLLFSSSQTSSISRSVPARLSDLRFAISVSVPFPVVFGASLLLSPGKASSSCSGRFFCRCPLMSRAAYWPFPLFPFAGYRSGLRSPFPARPIRCSTFRPWSASRALPTTGSTTPFADFCDTIRMNRFTVSHQSVT